MKIKHRLQLVELLKYFELPLIAAEVGVAEGNFSFDLLNEGIEKLYSIDYWDHIPNISGDGNFSNDWHSDNYDRTVERLKRFGEKSIILKGKSTEMAKFIPDNSLGLVHLDGDHSTNGVWNDLNAYFPKLIDGGIMSGHDYLAPEYGVMEAVMKFCEGRFSVYVIPEDNPVDAGFYFIKS